MQKGKIFVVGFGPGDREHITKRAVDALQQSDHIMGYKTYVELIEHLVTAKTIVSTGMTEEVSRAQEAVKQAEAGHIVSVISSDHLTPWTVIEKRIEAPMADFVIAFYNPKSGRCTYFVHRYL